MIKTLGDLLSTLIAQKKPLLDNYALDIKHPTMIGDMYEGLTREIASRSLPADSDLRVVKGKIVNHSRSFSRQIDCMIVEGDGEQLPYSQDWIYPSEKVVMIIEVKKTLYKTNLIESLDLFSHYFHDIYEPKDMVNSLLYDAWRSIYGTKLPSREAMGTLDGFSQALYHALAVEANMPVRVVIGYDGYASEKTLREGLFNIIQERAGTGPGSLPNLIISGDSSLVKLNGMPYPAHFDNTTQDWPFYGSRATNPIRLFLELLWTRLNYYHGYSSSFFGDDLDSEVIKPFLDAKPTFVDNTHVGWNINAYKSENLDSVDESDMPWMPEIIEEAEFSILYPLTKGREVDSTDRNLLEYLAHKNTTLQSVSESLKQKRLAYLEGRHFQLLTEKLVICFVPKLGCVAADDNSGRFSRWLVKRGLTPA